MITVSVHINDTLILMTSAVRIKGHPGERCTYKTLNGRIITHDYDEGAAALAKRLLDIPDDRRGV